MSELHTSRLVVTVPPAAEPITLAEAKLFLRIEHEADDTLIRQAIAAVREAVEAYLSYALLPQTLQYTLDYPAACVVALPRGPVAAITSVTSTDENGVATVWAATNYRASSDGFSLLLKQHPRAAVLTIAYTASLADTAAALPALIRQGMLHHLAVAVEARDGAVPMPMMSVQCYAPFRRLRVG